MLKKNKNEANQARIDAQNTLNEIRNILGLPSKIPAQTAIPDVIRYSQTTTAARKDPNRSSPVAISVPVIEVAERDTNLQPKTQPGIKVDLTQTLIDSKPK